MTDASPDYPRIGVNELNNLLQGEEEIALLDAREELSFGQAHILYASCMPLSRLELLADAMVPRRSVRIVVCDGGEGLAERAEHVDVRTRHPRVLDVTANRHR